MQYSVKHQGYWKILKIKSKKRGSNAKSITTHWKAVFKTSSILMLKSQLMNGKGNL